MSFLERFTPEHRALFESVAVPIDLPRGNYLIRRGEPGGDIYLLRGGALEVVDSRAQPEAILAVLQPGAVVGEMAFLDDSPRSADVRAASDAAVLQWPREDLRALLLRESGFAAAFYEAIARYAANRIRQVTTTAMAGGLTTRRPLNKAGLQRVHDEARRIAEVAKDALVDAETALRHDAGDGRARAAVRTILDRLQDDIAALFHANPEPEAASEATRVLGRDLNPYLVRSSLAERCIRRPQGIAGSPEILAHVFVDREGGDGQLGELLDRWLLDRPTLRALRGWRDPALQRVRAVLPEHRNRRILLVNAATGSLAAGIAQVAESHPTVLTVLDQSRDALALVDASVSGGNVEVRGVQEGFIPFATGRCRHDLPPQDVVVVHGLVEYLPDRLAVSLLTECARRLAPDGRLLVMSLAPSDDAPLLDRLLEWPTVRRSPDQNRRLFRAAGLDVRAEPAVPAPALLVEASRAP